MIRRIVLENFMSHSRTEIEPARGLTVLIGPNNCGKSAVVSALQTLCSNIAGDFMVRHGEKECRVTIETDDGHSVTWRRHRGAVSYVIDGREVPRGVTPDDLHDALRLPKVISEDGKDQFDIHFGSQKSPIFLLDESERRAAMFFASSSDAEYLMRMQKRHQEKVREAKRDNLKLTERLTKLNAELTGLEPVAELSEAMQALVQEHTVVTQQSELCQRIERDHEQLARQTEVFSRLTAELFCLSPLDAPPQLADVEPLEILTERLVQAESQRHIELGRTHALSDLRLPPELGDTQPIEQSIVRLEEAGEKQRSEQQRATATAQLTSPPVIVETELLEATMSRLADAGRLHLIEQERANAMATLLMPPALENTGPLEQVIGQLVQAEQTQSFEQQLATVTAKLDAPPVLADTDKVQELCNALAGVTRQVSQSKDCFDSLLFLRPAPELVDARLLEATVSELSSAVSAVERTSRGHDLLAALSAPPVLHEAESLSTLVGGCDVAKAEVASCEAEIARLHQEMTAVLDAVREWTTANPVCPTCGAEVNAERLMSWGHSHG